MLEKGIGKNAMPPTFRAGLRYEIRRASQRNQELNSALPIRYEYLLSAVTMLMGGLSLAFFFLTAELGVDRCVHILKEKDGEREIENVGRSQ